jgi:hypothetical protein
MPEVSISESLIGVTLFLLFGGKLEPMGREEEEPTSQDEECIGNRTTSHSHEPNQSS